MANWCLFDLCKARNLVLRTVLTPSKTLAAAPRLIRLDGDLRVNALTISRHGSPPPPSRRPPAASSSLRHRLILYRDPA